MPAPLSTASCPSRFLSPSLHFGWDLKSRQRGGIFAESSGLPCSGREQPVSMPSYISFLWQNSFLIFQINFFSSFAGLWWSPGMAVVPAAGQAAFPARLWSPSPPAFLHQPSAVPGTDGWWRRELPYLWNLKKHSPDSCCKPFAKALQILECLKLPAPCASYGEVVAPQGNQHKTQFWFLASPLTQQSQARDSSPDGATRAVDTHGRGSLRVPMAWEEVLCCPCVPRTAAWAISPEAML